MKKIFLLFLLCFVQICVYAQELTLSDVQNSGCMHGTRARANENEKSRTIILTKEGNILTVQLLGYEATCDIEDFIITPSVIDGSPCSVIIKVEYIDNDEDCICPYNISFTIHELESSSFRFSCWWYNGLVNLTEGEALVLEDIKENISIDGTIYTLDKVALTAKLIRKGTGESEVDIPSELSYEGQKYTMTGIGSYVFHSNAALTSITIPGSITYIGEAAFYGCSNLKEVCCQADDVPGTGSWVFDNTPIASATLHVPAVSIEAYKAKAPWKDFGNIVGIFEEYYPEGTRWTEIRLDTLKYDSWYSKVDGEWLPNFETIEYYVQGEYVEHRYQGQYEDCNHIYACVYTNGPEWADSLSFLVNKGKSEEGIDWGGMVTVAVFDVDNEPVLPGILYPLTWDVGNVLNSLDILTSNATGGGWPWEWDEYGTVDEIKEEYLGGVKPLKYSDVKGLRFIQTIGVTTWNDGECLFGPIRPYEVFSSFDLKTYPTPRHYRSMLVHFERDGEVLYDVWPEKGTDIKEYVTYTEGQMATIILPTTPDASKGKYYRLDRVEDERIVFEQELQPLAHVPYIIVPNEDFSIDLSTLDLAGCYRDTVSVDGISFIGSFVSEAFDYQEGFYIDFIDTTPDCRYDESCVIGALRAYLLVRWDDPYNQGGTKVPPLEKLEILLYDVGTGIDNVDVNDNGDIYDLQGRKLPSKPVQGVYIEDGKMKANKR